ncbi:unnamed protein product [Citrullus colocynthis]|uniref:Uncharacterized protein n=1 Tax=Citrullus colocynthis TaxID=252529 RepID=A0ABP0Y1R7_9ROSI
MLSCNCEKIALLLQHRFDLDASAPIRPKPPLSCASHGTLSYVPCLGVIRDVRKAYIHLIKSRACHGKPLIFVSRSKQELAILLKAFSAQILNQLHKQQTYHQIEMKSKKQAWTDLHAD